MPAERRKFVSFLCDTISRPLGGLRTSMSFNLGELSRGGRCRVEVVLEPRLGLLFVVYPPLSSPPLYGVTYI